jgi:glutaredoxin
MLNRLVQKVTALFITPSPEYDERTAADLQAFSAMLCLYQFRSCPFCARVRRTIDRLGLSIPEKDISSSVIFRDELERNGGSHVVPCLRIPGDGDDIWMYESADIVKWLESRVAEICARHGER